MTIAAGKLRHWVQLQAPFQVQDDSGDIINTWITQREVWAAIEPISGKEFIASAATQVQIVARITIRYASDVIATWRVLHGTKPYDIQGVLPDKESGMEYLTLPVSNGLLDEVDESDIIIDGGGAPL